MQIFVRGVSGRGDDAWVWPLPRTSPGLAGPSVPELGGASAACLCPVWEPLSPAAECRGTPELGGTPEAGGSLASGQEGSRAWGGIQNGTVSVHAFLVGAPRVTMGFTAHTCPPPRDNVDLSGQGTCQENFFLTFIL